MAIFKDTKGDAWTITITVGAAIKLRDELGLDVQTFIDERSETLEAMLSDSWKIVEILGLLLPEQIKRRNLTDEQFFERLEGSTLDDATIAFLEAVSESLPKLKRLPMQALIRKLAPTMDRATKILTEKVDAKDLETEIAEKVEAIEF